MEARDQPHTEREAALMMELAAERRKNVALSASNRGHGGRVERDFLEKTKLTNRILRLCDALKDLLAEHRVPVGEGGFPGPTAAMVEADAVLRREAKLGPWRVER